MEIAKFKQMNMKKKKNPKEVDIEHLDTHLHLVFVCIEIDIKHFAYYL